MKNKYVIRGVLTNVIHIGTSKNGNPRRMASLCGKVYKTMPDDRLGYSLSNFENQAVEAVVCEHWGVLSFVSIKRM